MNCDICHKPMKAGDPIHPVCPNRHLTCHQEFAAQVGIVFSLGIGEKAGRVNLEMSVADWEELLLALGYAAGAAVKRNDQFWGFIDLANRLNATNREFTPYEIPEEFRKKL